MIIWIIIIIIIIVFIFFKKNEGFKNDYSDYKNIDRITVDDKFAYCIGSTPICNSGSPLKSGIYAGGNTYRSYCDDGSTMVCNNFITNNLDISGDDYIWRTPNYTPIFFSQTYNGFTQPISYIPAIINNNNIDFYDINNNMIDSINKCSLLGLNENKCKSALNIPISSTSSSTSNSYNNSLNEINNSLGYISYLDPNTDAKPTIDNEYIFDIFPNEPKEEIKGVPGMYPNLPCIADYGSLPGDNVCNGEFGLLEDPGLICPYNKPICNYKCGSKLGTCNYSN